ncbi:unnamed protein product [Cunninghamella blakesleeana]
MASQDKNQSTNFISPLSNPSDLPIYPNTKHKKKATTSSHNNYRPNEHHHHHHKTINNNNNATINLESRGEIFTQNNLIWNLASVICFKVR